VVVAGLGAKGGRLAAAFHAQKRRVVAIERDGSSPGVENARRLGIEVLVGDAGEAEELRAAGLEHAETLVVTTGDDGRNVEIAAAAADGVGPRAQGAPTAFVHLDDLELWRRLQAQILATPGPTPLRLAFFNVHEAAARLLVERHPPALPRPESCVLIVGTGPLARALVVTLARSWPEDEDGGVRPPVLLAGADAADVRASLLAVNPGLERRCRLEARPLPPPASVTTAYVCDEDGAAGLAAAKALRGDLEGSARVVLAADGVTPAADDRVELFPVLDSTLTPELLERGTNEILARAKHAYYLESERLRGSADGNPSCVPWDRLGEGLKESNRLFADGIGEKLANAGYALVPAPLADPDDVVTFSEAEIEELARGEHERWSSDLRREGWRRGETSDPERRLHPSLVPWAELSEDERDKDREPVRALPRMLALVGFELQRAPAGT
jgi:hypothetical protein